MQPPRPRPAEGEDLVETASALAAEAVDAVGSLAPLRTIADALVEDAGLSAADARLATVAGAAVMAVVLPVALLRLARRRDTGLRGQACPWRRERFSRASTRLTAWRCGDCGVVAYSHDGRPPKECKRDLRDVGV